MAGRPLRPATCHSLGGLLPRQQADRTQAHLQVLCLLDITLHKKNEFSCGYPVLARLSAGILVLKVGYPGVTHPSAAFPREILLAQNPPEFVARLACVRHTASVHPELGSNPQNRIFKVYTTRVLHCSIFSKIFLRYINYTRLYSWCQYFTRQITSQAPLLVLLVLEPHLVVEAVLDHLPYLELVVEEAVPSLA